VKRGARFDMLDVMPSPGAMLAGAVAAQVVRKIVGLAASEQASSPETKETMIELVKVAMVAMPLIIAM